MKRGLILIEYFIFVATSAWSSSPVILNHSETIGNGDVMFIQGSGFGTSPTVEYAYNDGNWIQVPAIIVGNGTVSFKMPGDETRLPDVLTVRVSADSANWSAPVFVNVPEPSFVNTDQIAASSSFTIFGRNLYFSRMPSVRLVDQTDGSSHLASVDTTTSQHYKLSVMAPTGIVPNHTYQIYVNNGYSGNASAAVETLVPEVLAGRGVGIDYWQLGLPWASDLNFYNNVYNVKQDPRLNGVFATGNGVADDTWPIFNAIQIAVAAGGGVVYLPDGTYTIHFSNGCGIQLPSRVVLQGSGASNVTINYGYPAGTTGGFGACFGSQTGLADLSMNNVDTAQQWQFSALAANDSEVFLKRVNWNIGTSQWLNFVSDDHVAIENTTITQGTDSAFNYLGPLNLQACAHCQVSNSTITFTVCGMLFDRATDMVFQNNQVIRDISVSPPAITVTHSIAANFVKNFAVLNNQFNSVGNALATNNDGEVIVSEGGGPQRYDEFRGSATSANSMTITDQTQNFLQSPNTVPSIQTSGIARVSIVSGSGLGQTRMVTGVSADGTTLTIDQPWQVIPDITSHYATFDWSAENWLIVNNSLNGNFKGFELFNASASNVLFESNALVDSDGIMVSPGEYAAQPTSGALFNVIDQLNIVGNSFTDHLGLRPAYVGLIPREDLQATSFGTHILGASIKANNVITAFTPNVFNAPPSWDDYKVKTEGYLCDYFWQSSTSYDTAGPPPLLANIFQNNFASGSNEAFYLNSGAAQTVIADSYMNNVGLPQLDVTLQGATSGSQQTEMIEVLSLFPVGLASSTDLLQATASYYGGQAIGMGHQAGTIYSVSGPGDSLNLFGKPSVGGMDVVAHVTLTANTTAAGALMMRESISSKSALVSIALSKGAIVVNTRSSDGGSLQTTSSAFTGTAVWLRLRYFSSSVAALFSTDGKEWTQFNTVANFANQTYLTGVADLSMGNEAGIEATFDGLAFTPISVVTTSPKPAVSRH